MKSKILFTGLFLLLFGLPACQEFLDVNPRETTKSDVLYSTQNGYKNALTGVYLMLADESLYGKNTSMYLPELLARHWSIPVEDVTSNRYIISNYDFADYKGNSLFSTIWTHYYKAIAQLNDLLAALENPECTFTHNTDKLVEAEARGLRAFIHLEILRFWGPVPSLATADTRAIPYVTQLTYNADALVSESWATVVERIKSDLDRAEELLAGIDPIILYKPDALNKPEGDVEGLSDSWYYYRQNRFNYYAVLATKARLYNWIATNNAYEAEAKPLAVLYAKQVIDAQNEAADKPQFALVERSTQSINGLTMFSECIFAIHNPKLHDITKSLFINDEPDLTQTTDHLNVAYESSLNSNDIRYGSINTGFYWKATMDASKPQFNHFYKFDDGNGVTVGTNLYTQNLVPVLRLPEMYFILIENLPLAEANGFFNTFRLSRNMDRSLDNSLVDGSVNDRLEKEYRKEFYGEGQMFFFYKRLKYLSFTYPDAFTLPEGLNNYRLPLPKTQQAFEN